MSVVVDKLKSEFLNIMNDMFNQDYYFIDSCKKFPDKYSFDVQVIDRYLKIIYEENRDKCGIKVKNIQHIKE